MINKLYSILVSGSDPIPTSFCMYRRYSSISVDPRCVLVSSDPYRKATWANFIIETAKGSDLYQDIIARDKSNTYSVSPVFDIYNKAEGCSIIRSSNVFPVIDFKYNISDNVVVGSVNGADIIREVKVSDGARYVDILDAMVSLSSNSGYLTYSNPAVSMEIPDISTLSGLQQAVPRAIRDKASMNKMTDRAALYGVSLLEAFK